MTGLGKVRRRSPRQSGSARLEAQTGHSKLDRTYLRYQSVVNYPRKRTITNQAWWIPTRAAGDSPAPRPTAHLPSQPSAPPARARAWRRPASPRSGQAQAKALGARPTGPSPRPPARAPAAGLVGSRSSDGPKLESLSTSGKASQETNLNVDSFAHTITPSIHSICNGTQGKYPRSTRIGIILLSWAGLAWATIGWLVSARRW